MSAAGHAYHESLPGYDARQIWRDGCEECEARGAHVPESIGTLDPSNFHRAWARMLLWRDSNIGGSDEEKFAVLGRISDAELPLLRFLESCYMVQCRLDGTW